MKQEHRKTLCARMRRGHMVGAAAVALGLLGLPSAAQARPVSTAEVETAISNQAHAAIGRWVIFRAHGYSFMPGRVGRIDAPRASGHNGSGGASLCVRRRCYYSKAYVKFRADRRGVHRVVGFRWDKWTVQTPLF